MTPTAAARIADACERAAAVFGHAAGGAATRADLRAAAAHFRTLASSSPNGSCRLCLEPAVVYAPYCARHGESMLRPLRSTVAASDLASSPADSAEDAAGVENLREVAREWLADWGIKPNTTHVTHEELVTDLEDLLRETREMASSAAVAEAAKVTKTPWVVIRYVEKDDARIPSAYARGHRCSSEVYLDVSGRWNAWAIPTPNTFATAEEAMRAVEALDRSASADGGEGKG